MKLVTMSNKDEIYKLGSVGMIKEADDYVIGQPSVWKKEIGESVTSGELAIQAFKAAMPLMKGVVRTDALIISDIPTALGVVHTVQPYSGIHQLPAQFLLVMPGRIPYPVSYQRGMFGIGGWKYLQNGANTNSFCSYIDNVQYQLPGKKPGTTKKLGSAPTWEYTSSAGQVNLEWTIQLVPLENDRFLFLFRYPAEFHWTSQSFGFAKFMEMAKAVGKAVTALNYSGPAPKCEMVDATLSVFAVPELVGEIPESAKGSLGPAATPQAPPAPPKPQPTAAQVGDEPLTIAKKRLALGEITLEEFERIRQALE